MTKVLIEPRPKGGHEGSSIDDYVVEGKEIASSKHSKPGRGIMWAKSEGDSHKVARVRHLNDKTFRTTGGQLVSRILWKASEPGAPRCDTIKPQFRRDEWESRG